MTTITDRIERDLGVPGLTSMLAEILAPTDLQSLLLEVYRRRAATRTGPAVLADYEKNRFVQPAGAAPAESLAWDSFAFSALPDGFAALELSPVCPLGSCSSVAGVSQDWSIGTSRNTEVVSDATNALALEAARRRKAYLVKNPGSGECVHLAASHRVIRAQNYAGAGMLPHFRLFALCSAGRDRGSFAFEIDTFRLHLGFYLRTIAEFLNGKPKLQFAYSVYDHAVTAAPAFDRMVAELQDEFPDAECVADPDRSAGRDYYQGLSFHLNAILPSGEVIQLADGGSVDWTAKLAGNRKERLVISGIGTERLCSLRSELGG